MGLFLIIFSHKRQKKSVNVTDLPLENTGSNRCRFPVKTPRPQYLSASALVHIVYPLPPRRGNKNHIFSFIATQSELLFVHVLAQKFILKV